jgi:hypothetical protein
MRMRSWGLLRKRDETGRHVMTRARDVDGKEVVACIGSLLAVTAQKAAAASRVGPRLLGLMRGIIDE